MYIKKGNKMNYKKFAAIALLNMAHADIMGQPQEQVASQPPPDFGKLFGKIGDSVKSGVSGVTEVTGKTIGAIDETLTKSQKNDSSKTTPNMNQVNEKSAFDKVKDKMSELRNRANSPQASAESEYFPTVKVKSGKR